MIKSFADSSVEQLSQLPRTAALDSHCRTKLCSRLWLLSRSGRIGDGAVTSVIVSLGETCPPSSYMQWQAERECRLKAAKGKQEAGAEFVHAHSKRR